MQGRPTKGLCFLECGHILFDRFQNRAGAAGEVQAEEISLSAGEKCAVGAVLYPVKSTEDSVIGGHHHPMIFGAAHLKDVMAFS